MATIQVRNIPEENAELLRRAAADAGMSLQAYMQREVNALARRQTKLAALEAYREEFFRQGSSLPPGFAADAVRELRGE
ncbi:FitA-like ribbon-helix-helix domain-containing protein [Nocardia sp. NPDC051570]|uniref:FitA-like ribbon-helix-helix domain-containing protein n=1 Tax=Nocardia sp. NPDC051570 TaxID=3364324 RepID=UPI00378C8882